MSFPDASPKHFLLEDGPVEGPSEDLHLRRRRLDDLKEAAKARTFDFLRSKTSSPRGDELAIATWKRIDLLREGDLSLLARLRIGEGHDCLSFDSSGDFLIVGSGFRKTVKVVPRSDRSSLLKKKVGFCSDVFPTGERGIVILAHGPTGNVAVFNAETGAVEQELAMPTFGPADTKNSRIVLGVGRPIPWAQVPVGSGFERSTAESPIEPVSGYQWMKGSEGVSVVDSLAVMDARTRSVVDAVPIEPIEWSAPTWSLFQLSPSGRRLFAHVPGRLLAIDVDSGLREYSWDLPAQLHPRFVVGEGESVLATTASDGDVHHAKALVRVRHS
jgi:hypothetical protein